MDRVGLSVLILVIGHFALVGSLGCGGSATPAESPEESGEESSEGEEAAEPSSGGEEPPGAEGEKEAGDKTPAKSGGETANSADDVRTVLQLVIDDETLVPFLHLDQPGRFPLQIAGSGLPEGLTKSMQPVKIVPAPSSKKDPVLVFTSIEIKGKHATVKFRYDIEGMQGSAVLDKGAYGWELTRSKVTER